MASFETVWVPSFGALTLCCLVCYLVYWRGYSWPWIQCEKGSGLLDWGRHAAV